MSFVNNFSTLKMAFTKNIATLKMYIVMIPATLKMNFVKNCGKLKNTEIYKQQSFGQTMIISSQIQPYPSKLTYFGIYLRSCVSRKKFISKPLDMKSFGHTMTILPKPQVKNGKKGNIVASTFNKKS